MSQKLKFANAKIVTSVSENTNKPPE